MKQLYTLLAATALAVTGGTLLANDTQVNNGPNHTGPGLQNGEVWQPLQQIAQVWDTLKLGVTPSQATAFLGMPPEAMEARESLDVIETHVTWLDAWGGKWTAVFVCNRLVRKMAAATA